MECESCGAGIAEGFDWCPRCLTRVVVERPASEQNLGTAELRWRPEPRHLDPIPKLPRSRVRGGNLTYGWRGRIVMTFVVCLPCWLMIAAIPLSGGMSIIAALPLGMIAVWCIPGIWRKERVMVDDPLARRLDPGLPPYRPSM